MNISNLLTVSAAVTIAVAGTIYGQHDPVLNYYAITPGGCVLNSNPGCVTSGALQCTVFIDGNSCLIKRQAEGGTPCAVTMYRN